MNWRAIGTLIRKDCKVTFQNKGVTIPMILVPLIFFVIIPGLVALIPPDMDLSAGPMADFQELLDRIPGGLANELAAYEGVQKVVVLTLVYLFAPFFLIVPLMVASTVAADSFAGEKERKTLEALLYTPTTDLELFLGKVLAAWLAALVVAVGGFILYSVVANAAGWRVMGQLFFPNVMWLALVLWVAPAAAGLGLGAMVLVSSRAKTFQEAYQIGGAVVIPILLLVFFQITGVMYFSVGLVLLLGALLWIVDGALLWFGIRSFGRSESITRL
jgi:ABC-type transport system involved in multi-copper enzyme maturation permease subunit